MLRSHLSRHVPASPANEDDLQRMRSRAWHQQEVLNVDLSNDRLTWVEREELRNIGNKLYGKRAS